LRPYKSKVYANDRLVNTIARVKNTPAMIQKITDTKVQWVDLSEFNTNPVLRADPLEDLDINPVPLGYCNHKDSAVYLMREPIRRDWKQGLRCQTLMALRDGEEIKSASIAYEDLAKTIIGDYPTFGKVFQTAVDKALPYSVAWDRSFMVKHTLEIVYREEVVIGKIDINADPNHGVVDINPSMEWVLEELEASIKW